MFHIQQHLPHKEKLTIFYPNYNNNKKKKKSNENYNKNETNKIKKEGQNLKEQALQIKVDSRIVNE